MAFKNENSVQRRKCLLTMGEQVIKNLNIGSGKGVDLTDVQNTLSQAIIFIKGNHERGVTAK